jgi:histone-lysine N-methyltransferase SETMAR
MVSAWYCAVLEEELKPAVCGKQRGMLTKGVVLHHDNTQIHMAALTVEMIQKLKFELLPHPAFSPDLGPSDYHIFGPLRDVLHGCRFANSEEVKYAVHTWLCVQPRTFFTDGIRELMD